MHRILRNFLRIRQSSLSAWDSLNHLSQAVKSVTAAGKRAMRLEYEQVSQPLIVPQGQLHDAL